MYSSEVGRFLQPDPIGYWDDLNLYRYCGNNPLNWIDSLGMQRQDGYETQQVWRDGVGWVPVYVPGRDGQPVEALFDIDRSAPNYGESVVTPLYPKTTVEDKASFWGTIAGAITNIPDLIFEVIFSIFGKGVCGDEESNDPYNMSDE